MEHGLAGTANAVLQALADLAPTNEQRPAGLAVPTEWFRWLPMDAVRLFAPVAVTGIIYSDDARQAMLGEVSIDRAFGDRLAAVDQVRAEQRSLRVGWLFVAGRMEGADGKPRRVFQPLVTIPVRVQRSLGFGNARLLPAGDVELTELVTDDRERHELERHIALGGGALDGMRETEIPPAYLLRLDRLHRFARSVAAAAGLPATRLVPATDGPDSLMRYDDLFIVAGVGVYAVREVRESSRASSLRAWANTNFKTWTAFHSLYLDGPPADSSESPSGDPVESPYLLTPVQREAVSSSRREPITLVSGAPGTGKSHTIAATACDALGRGERVLVAAKSDATVDALLDLLERGPGPEPVVFGSNERRAALADRLSGGQLQPTSDSRLATSRQRVLAGRARRGLAWQSVADALGAEQLLGQPDATVSTARSVAPGLFAPDTDLDRAAGLIATCVVPAQGWRARRRRNQAWDELRRLMNAAPNVAIVDAQQAFAVARAARLAGDLKARGGLDLRSAWAELLAADDEERAALGQWLEDDCRSTERLNHATLPAVAAVATALRSGRSARREQLRRLDDDKLTRALPLWVGTLADVDDLLPPVPGSFDLVILDEASSIDQPLAAAALLRGRRAVIAGDPRQLRQVSFVPDVQLEAVMHAHGLDDEPVLAARLDVRRNSTFDLAAGACPVLVLDEHFRSAPHLVEFVARRLYDGKVRVATRSPRTQSIDCVDVIRTDGHRDTAGVVVAEVDRAVAEAGALLRAGERSVGVVTPFRAQADALEEAMLKAFSADELERLDLRVGTVHAFQGNERDMIIASFGLGPEEGATSWRFVEDPQLFAVFVSRARRRMTMLLSADPPEGGLVAAYLAQADAPPGPPKPVAPIGPWATLIADDLSSADVPVLKSYPTGRHVVDICVADERHSIGIECEVHPDGPDAHIERHLALTRAGWELLDAYRSRWGDRRGELIVNLVNTLNGLSI